MRVAIAREGWRHLSALTLSSRNISRVGLYARALAYAAKVLHRRFLPSPALRARARMIYVSDVDISAIQEPAHL